MYLDQINQRGSQIRKVDTILMTQQLVRASVSLGTDADAGIGIYRSEQEVRLHVLAADGSGRADFVHRAGGDSEKSAVFLRSLAEHALYMASVVSGPWWPVPDPER